jgi:hypothetical protein
MLNESSHTLGKMFRKFVSQGYLLAPYESRDVFAVVCTAMLVLSVAKFGAMKTYQSFRGCGRTDLSDPEPIDMLTQSL